MICCYFHVAKFLQGIIEMAVNNSVFNIPLKVNKDFSKALGSIEETYGEDFEVLNGFAERNLNFSDFIDAFTAKNAVTADVTIDANANASTKDIRALLNEKDKPLDKIFAFNKLFLELKQKYGLKTAREWLNQEYNGGFYLHDACTSTYMGYCFAYDLTRLAKEGLFFLKNYNNEGIGGALGSTILTAAQNYGSQYLPTLGGKVAQFIDPTQRTTKSSATSPVGGNMDYYWRSLVKKVPGAEATLQPDVNIWGQTTTKDSFGDWALDFANKFILPTNVKIANRDAVDNELIRVVESTGNADFLPSDGAKYFKVNGETYKMNASQYTEYSKERGQAAYAAIKELMQSPSYINATDETKAEMLRKAREAAYKTVNNIWKDRLGAFNH